MSFAIYGTDFAIYFVTYILICFVGVVGYGVSCRLFV